MTFRRIAFVTNLAAILLAVALVWEPEVAAYWVEIEPTGDVQIERARSAPTDALLDEIGRQRFGIPDKTATWTESERVEVLSRAEELFAGKARFSNEPAVDVSFPFSRANLGRGLPPFQLHIASMGTVDLLLDGYRSSGEERYLDAAARELRAFARVDRWSLIPRGLLWNDHALANRMSILAETWSLVRKKPNPDPQLAKDILDLAARTAARLAKPNLFTFRTNHGVMQNLALLQYAAAFPSLADSAAMKAIGCERLSEQLRYYVSDHGVVLEHSAGYQEFGRDLLEAGVRLAAVTGCATQSELERVLNRVWSTSALLRRPDGSLPVFGNTDYALRVEAAPGAPVRPGSETSVLPASGLAVWWTGLEQGRPSLPLTQTVINWSAFPSRAHKHADEMSLVIWANGQPWIGGTGYWPYSSRGYDEAQGWRSSNAPHYVGEPTLSDRTTRFRGAVATSRLRAIDLERRSADGSRLRRQVIQVDGIAWIVVDSVDSPNPANVERLWTLPSNAQVRSVNQTTYLVSRPSGGDGRLSIGGDLVSPPSVLNGSYRPFGGWIIGNGRPAAAPAIVVTQRSRKSIGVSVFETGKADNHFERIALPVFSSAGSGGAWRVLIELSDGPAEISWEGTRIAALFSRGHESLTTAVADTTQSDAQRNAIIAAYHATAERYPRFREITAYRYKVTWVWLLLVLLQESVAHAVRRVAPRLVPALRILASISWVGCGLYAGLIYLR